MRAGVDILIDGTYRGVEGGVFDSLGELCAGRLHAGAVESTADLERKGTFRTGGFCLLTGFVDGLDFAGDDELTGAVVVGAHYHAVDAFTDFLNLCVGEGNDGCHGGGLELAGFLHGLGTGADETQTILEAECAGSYKSRELAERVTGGHVGLDVAFECLGEDYRVEKYGRLGHLGLAQILVGTGKHKVGDTETENFIGFLKHFVCHGIVVVEVFAHAYKLSSLAREYVSCHNVRLFYNQAAKLVIFFGIYAIAVNFAACRAVGNSKEKNILRFAMDNKNTVNIATMPLRPVHYRVLVTASLGQMIGQGLATLVGIMIPLMQLLLHPELSAGMQGLLGCISLIGLALGALIIGKLSDRYGYLLFFRLCPSLIIAASVGAFFFHPVWALAVWLFMMGVGVGGEYSLDSDYISELMPKRWKLIMVGVAKATAAVGSVIVAALCFWVIREANAPDIWPNLLVIMTVMAAITLLLRVRFPESPDWLIQHGRSQEAEKQVKMLFGPDAYIEVPSTPPSPAPQESFGVFFKRNARNLLLSGVPWACEGLGVYGIGIFLPILIMALGLQHSVAGATQIDHIESSVELTMWLSLIMAVGFIIGLLFMKRIYHVKMQAWGFFLSGISLAVLLAAYRLHWPSWIAIVAFMLFELFLNAGPHLITFILPPQIYPVKDRGTGVGASACIGKIGAIAGAFFIPMLLTWGGSTLVLVVSIIVMVIGGLITAWVGPKVVADTKK